MKRLILSLCVISIFGGCKNEQPEQTKQADLAIPVTVVQSKSIRFQPEYVYSGTALPYKEANLGTSLPGRVEKIHARVGEMVEKGELLAGLSSELFLQAQIEAQTLKKDFERVSRLRKKGSISQQDYDHVKAKYEAAKAKESLMRKNAQIKAPFPGIVVDHLVEEGENFLFAPSFKSGYSMTSGIIQLMQLNPLKIKFEINEKDLPDLTEKMQARIVFDAYPNSPQDGTVDFIEPLLSTQTRTAKGYIKLPNSKHTFKPGMFAKVHILLPEQEGIQIPMNAIYRQPGTGNDFVFVVDENKAIRKPVERLKTKGSFLIVEGINGGETIVVDGKNKITDGDKVEIKEAI